MDVLVAYASRYGGTRAIAEAIGEQLRSAGFEVDVLPADEVVEVGGYDAFVVGSGIYFGRWLQAARGFVRRHRAVLAARPTWLFSSGPLATGSTAAPDEQLRAEARPHELPALLAQLDPVGSMVFSGVLAPATLRLRHRALRRVAAGRATLPEGDWREWWEIERWAVTIAGDLQRRLASA